jgi:hypothetical protein
MPWKGGRQPGAGRKKGVPNKATAELKAMAGKWGPAIIDRLAELAGLKGKNPAKQEVTAMAAMKELLDRGYGKVRPPVEDIPEGYEPDPDIAHETTGMSALDVMRHAQAMHAANGDWIRAAAMAKEIAPYETPKLMPRPEDQPPETHAEHAMRIGTTLKDMRNTIGGDTENGDEPIADT